jgi:hypothetical protein
MHRLNLPGQNFQGRQCPIKSIKSRGDARKLPVVRFGRSARAPSEVSRDTVRSPSARSGRLAAIDVVADNDLKNAH